jgi:hypothetical protein
MNQRKVCPACGLVQAPLLDCSNCGASLIKEPLIEESEIQEKNLSKEAFDHSKFIENSLARPSSPDNRATLVLQVGPGQNIRLKSGDVIGREAMGAEHIRSNLKVSRLHAKVIYTDGQWTIKDLDSANGMYIDGQLSKEAVLGLGSTLCLSKSCELTVIKC